MKHIHFIGICGVAMGGLAIAFKKAGWKVTGSDAGFFPPVSDYLKKNKIDFYPGWHPELMIKNGAPDLVVVGNIAGSANPEWLYVQENKLNYKSYPEVIAEYFVKQNSLVCAGTYGKTTTAALLSWILTQAGYNPSYMFGGIAVDDFDSASLGNNEPRKVATLPRGNYSVIEGDEYKSARWDGKAKFFHYHPTHLLLTDVKWDHADMYPTAESYFKAFEKLIKSMPKKGMMVASENVSKQVLKLASSQVITYGKTHSTMYQCSNVTMNKDGLEFTINHNSKNYKLKAKTLGDYWAENITGVFALAHQIGIEPEKIISAIDKFKGLKRRLEKRYDEKITVFDDIAHSPAKVRSVLENLAKIYKCHCEDKSPKQSHGIATPSGLAMTAKKIICVFEPNTGNRQPQSEPNYANAFTAADEVIIPKLTKLKTSAELKHWEGDELRDIIGKTHSNVKYIDDDDKLINYLTNKQNSVIVFCGSHGFRGMIDELVSSFRTPHSRGEESLFKAINNVINNAK